MKNYYELMPEVVCDYLLMKMDSPDAEKIIGFIDTMVRIKFRRTDIRGS